MMAALTRHAHARQRQRAIPNLILQWLIDFGQREFDKHGAYRLFFSKKSLRRIERECGREIVRRLADFWDTYMVMSLDGAVITVGYNT